MNVKIAPSWKEALQTEFNKPYFTYLTDFVKQQYKTQRVYPPGSKIFAAFDHCPLDQLKVVILGQDPYHGPGQANGLCFSVAPGVPMPPSLINIFKEVQADLGHEMPPNGNLERWAQQGVLLLNATLTVQAGQAASHQGKGWEEFTDAVIQTIAQQCPNTVFMLWGSFAQKKAAFVSAQQHCILKSAHPSPLAAHRGFFGNKHFSQANAYLESHGKTPIEW